jgi:hypothetical protein
LKPMQELIRFLSQCEAEHEKTPVTSPVRWGLAMEAVMSKMTVHQIGNLAHTADFTRNRLWSVIHAIRAEEARRAPVCRT